MSGKIQNALKQISERTTVETRIVMTERWVELNPNSRAKQMFHFMGLDQSIHQNSMLLYINTRKQKFSFVFGDAIYDAIPKKSLDEIVSLFKSDLHSTHFENAISLTLQTLCHSLEKVFPRLE